MCKECGCGLPGENPVGISAHRHDHDHEHGHDHHHDHDHDHGHTHSHEADAGAASHFGGTACHSGQERPSGRAQPRLFSCARPSGSEHSFVPGSGKTTFIRETIRSLGKQLKTGVIVGDLATDNDAERLRKSGAPVVQITTGTVCHLEAEMVAHALDQLDLNGLDLLIIENVGNLVCPASYDLGEDLRVVLLSVTEGEDKPLKYPPMFQSAGVVVISKMDLATACDYDRQDGHGQPAAAHPKAPVFETSAKTGQGMEAWCDFLIQQHQKLKTRKP